LLICCLIALVNPKVPFINPIQISKDIDLFFTSSVYVYYGMFEDVYRRKSFLAGGIFSTVASQVLGACILSFA